MLNVSSAGISPYRPQWGCRIVLAMLRSLCGHKSTLLVSKVARDPGSPFCKCKIWLCPAQVYKKQSSLLF